MLATVKDAGVKRYNRCARRSVEALERAGLVRVEYALNEQMGGRHTEEAAVILAGAGLDSREAAGPLVLTPA